MIENNQYLQSSLEELSTNLYDSIEDNITGFLSKTYLLQNPPAPEELANALISITCMIYIRVLGIFIDAKIPKESLLMMFWNKLDEFFYSKGH